VTINDAVTPAIDNDTTYTASTSINANAASGFVRITGGGVEDDILLVDIWNSSSANKRVPDNASTYNRVVLRWAAGTELSVSSGAQVYYHRPVVDNITNDNIYTVSNSNITIIDTMATQNDNASIAVDSVDNNTLVFLFPEAQWETTLDTDEDLSTHYLVLDNVSIDGTPYVLHIAPPTGTSPIVATGDVPLSADTGSLPGITYFRKVFLQTTDNVSVQSTGTVVSAELDNTTTLTFMENVDGTTPTLSAQSNGVNYTDSDTDGVSDETTATGITSFTRTASASGSVVSVRHETSFGETPTTNELIGHGAAFTITATDDAGNRSTVTITRNRAHGANLNGYPVITNTISGSALE
jgi:hypothetical protein